MNTPKSTPTRYPFAKARKMKDDGLPPSGTSTQHIASDEIAALIGRIVIAWTTVEEMMIRFMNLLIVGKNDESPARQIFRSIMAERVRINVMKALLQYAPHNHKLDQRYDELLGEFDRLNTRRNAYVHGVWWTHENGDVYLEESTEDGWDLLRQRSVPAKEISDVLSRIYALREKLVDFCFDLPAMIERSERLASSRGRPSLPDDT